MDSLSNSRRFFIMNLYRPIHLIHKLNLFNRACIRMYSSDVIFKERPNGNKIAFRRHVSDNLDNIGVVFCSGFQSNMDGAKGEALEKFCSEENLPFIRFVRCVRFNSVSCT